MRDPVHIAQRWYRKASSADDSYDRFVSLNHLQGLVIDNRLMIY